MKKLIAHLQERTGIFSLGFDQSSIAGITLPLAVVVIVGGGLAFLITR